MEAESIEVPFELIEADTVTALAEAFVLQEGTDYGAEESLFATKVAAVRRQLVTGEAKILFFPEEDLFVIVPARALTEPRPPSRPETPLP